MILDIFWGKVLKNDIHFKGFMFIYIKTSVNCIFIYVCILNILQNKINFYFSFAEFVYDCFNRQTILIPINRYHCQTVKSSLKFKYIFINKFYKAFSLVLTYLVI